MARAVVVLASARNRQVAVNGEIVFGFAPQRPAVEPLPLQADRPLQVAPHDLANEVAGEPIESSALHCGKGSRPVLIVAGKALITEHTPMLPVRGQIRPD